MFTSRSQLMYHKRKHKNQVPLCKKNMNGTCWFGNNNCWFIHEEVNKSEQMRKNEEFTKDKDIVEKIFNMMETFTKRITEIEQQKNKDEDDKEIKSETQNKLMK